MINEFYQKRKDSVEMTGVLVVYETLTTMTKTLLKKSSSGWTSSDDAATKEGMSIPAQSSSKLRFLIQ